MTKKKGAAALSVSSKVYEIDNATEGLDVEGVVGGGMGCNGLVDFCLIFEMQKSSFEKWWGIPVSFLIRCLSVPKKVISFDRDQSPAPSELGRRLRYHPLGQNGNPRPQ